MADKYESVVQVDIVDHVDNGNTTFTGLVDKDPTTHSCCQRSWKLLVIFLVLAVMCIVGLVIYINVKSPTDDCKKPIINIPNNSSSLDDQEKQYNRTYIYKTSAEFLKKLVNDSFGDLCKTDSSICQKGRSTHACKSCGNEKEKFPSFCFCDKKEHCNHKDGEIAFDSQRKSYCPDCLRSFHRSPFSARGTCNCQEGKISLQCDCHEGFSGFMCSSIVLRYCKPKDNIEPEIPHCKDSNKESCRQDGKYLCVAFDDSNRKQRRSATSCENIVTT